MSLLSNRGRFTSDKIEEKLIENDSRKETSSISSFGTNPNSLFSFDNTNKHKEQTEHKNHNEHIELKEKKNSFIVDNREKKIDDRLKHKEILLKNKNLMMPKRNLDDGFNKTKINDGFKKKTTKKDKWKLYLLMGVVELLTIVGIYFLGSFIRLSQMTQNVVFSKSAVQNKDIDVKTLEVMKGYKTVAIFGVDSRTGSVDKGNNADVNIIANLNLETGEASLVSVYRDLYLSVTDQNQYDKLNAAYRKGGPQSAVKALNKNLDLNITNFFSFNWKAVADAIELLGGIDINITKSEYRYMNAFIHETCIATGIDAKNPAAHYIRKSGDQHLNGVQAVAYGRLRLMDSDFQRVERQKKVIALCLEKAKELDFNQIRIIMEAILPQIAYEFDMNEMLSIAKLVKKINIVTSCGCPETNNIVMQDMGEAGDAIVPLSLEKAVVKLHKVLFDEEKYEVSLPVKRYSNRIIELRKQYEEINAKKASIKASEEAESKLKTNLPKATVTKSSSSNTKKASTRSNTNKDNANIKTDPNASRDNNEVTIPNFDTEYEPEPESDNISYKVGIDENGNLTIEERIKETTVGDTNGNVVRKVTAPYMEGEAPQNYVNQNEAIPYTNPGSVSPYANQRPSTPRVNQEVVTPYVNPQPVTPNQNGQIVSPNMSGSSQGLTPTGVGGQGVVIDGPPGTSYREISP